jgi:hypothetical protein
MSSPTSPARPYAKRGVAGFAFAVPCDDKSHLWVSAEVREFEPANKAWCVAGTCRRWRGEYLHDGLYSRTEALGDEFVVVARGKSVSDALDALARTAVMQATGDGMQGQGSAEP